MTDSELSRQRVEKIKKEFLEKLVENLRSRFPDGNILSAFMVFDPESLPPHENIREYGKNEIKVLDLHFGHMRGETPAEVDPAALVAEWSVFKYQMSREFRGKSFGEMCKDMLSENSPFLQDFPQINKLLSIALCTSVDCDRGFSQSNIIKTPIRNRLNVEEVNLLMQISLDTPSIQDISDFDFQRAFHYWANPGKASFTGRKFLRK
jgi:hypothetical protein